MFIFNLTLVRLDLLLQLQILFFSSLANRAKMFQRKIVLRLCFQTLCEEFEHKRYKMFIQLLEEENRTLPLQVCVQMGSAGVCKDNMMMDDQNGNGLDVWMEYADGGRPQMVSPMEPSEAALT